MPSDKDPFLTIRVMLEAFVNFVAATQGCSQAHALDVIACLCAATEATMISKEAPHA